LKAAASPARLLSSPAPAPGIGQATARRCAEEGAQVAVADVRREAARKTAGELEGAIAIELDVASRESVAAGLQAVAQAFGGVDVVVNNAGVTIVGAAHELSEEDWDRELDTNLKSIYLVSKAAWPLLLERGGGAIVMDWRAASTA
jgi:NAD(P)-dependent dehydrogenase (short-subunit alcohol dehydrogenase family)